jgi:hypothetical protein
MAQKCAALTADICGVMSASVVGTATSPSRYYLNRCSKPVSAGPQM